MSERRLIRTSQSGVKSVSLFLIIALLFVFPAPVLAGDPDPCTTNWVGPVEGDWDVPGNWSAGVPDASDYACVKGNGAHVEVIGNPTDPSNPRINVAGNIYVGPGAQLTIMGGGGGCVYGVSLLTVTNDINNDGLIYFNNWNSCSARISVGGTLNNSATGTIDVSWDGADGWIRGDVLNNGLIKNTQNASNVFEFNQPGASFVNSGTIQTVDGSLLLVRAHDGTNTHTFQQSGTMTVPGTASFRMNGGTFTYSSGSTSGTPQLLNVALDPSGSGTGSLEVVGPSNTLVADIAAGKTLFVHGGGAGCVFGTTTLTSAASRANFGTIKFINTNSCSPNLTFTTGTLTNKSGGLIHAVNPAGGKIRANIVNEAGGVIEVDNPITFDKPGATYTNQGTIETETGKTLTIASSDNTNTHSFSQLGTLTAPGDQLTPGFRQNGGVFSTGAGSSATGYLALVGVSASLSAGSGTFEFRGNANNLTSNIGPNITAEINGGGPGGTFGPGKLTSANSFTNLGLIRFTHNNGFGSNLEVMTTGTLTNSATGIIRPVTSGPNTITANFNNSGLLDVDESLTFDKTNGTYDTSGTIDIASGKTLAFNQPLDQTGGKTVLGGGGATLDSNPTFSLQGGALEGTGQITGHLASGGIVRPGGSNGIGAITVTGTYLQSSDGDYNVQVTGPDPNQFDRLIVNGTATLDGDLNIDSTSYAPPTMTLLLNILSSTGLTGTFANVNQESTSGERSWKPKYEATAVHLEPLELAELTLDKSAPNSTQVGKTLTYTLTATNAGPDAAIDVTITDSLPAGVVFVSATPSNGGNCSGTTPTISCTFSTVGNGEAVSVTVKVRPLRTGTLTNSAEVSSVSKDDPAGSSDDVETTVLPNAAGCEILGTGAADNITGTKSADVICALGGNDTVNGGKGADKILGESGSDTLKGQGGRDQIVGGAGSDDLFGQGAADKLNAKDGVKKETVNGGPGGDSCKADAKDIVTSC